MKIPAKKYYICITPFFPAPDNWRGAYVLDQVKAISRNSDYNVIVFKPNTIFSKNSSYIINDVEVHHISSWFMPSYFFNGFGGFFNGFSLLKKIKELNINPDDIAVCHCHTAAFACFASAIKRLNKNIKTVIQYHDLDPYQVRLGRFAKWKPNITYRVNRFVSYFKNIDLHLCISRQTEYNLKHFPIPHPNEYYQPYLDTLNAAQHLVVSENIKSYVLYNGVDTSLFYKKNGLRNPNFFKIGCISNFNELKGHMTLIKAVGLIVNRHPEIKLKVSFIGSGETKKDCMEYIYSNNLEKYFAFEDEMSHDKLPDYFNSLNLFVLPSYFEGFGCVYTEAAACGVPFMGCYQQGYSEYIPDDEKNKWLIDPNDYKRLSQLIISQIKCPQEQHLRYSYDINTLVCSYLNHLINI